MINLDIPLVLAIVLATPIVTGVLLHRFIGWRVVCANLIRGGLWAIALVIVYYWMAWLDWRFQWVNRPFHLIIWNVRGGCLPFDHYPMLDWLVCTVFLFTIFGLLRLIFEAALRTMRSLTPRCRRI